MARRIPGLLQRCHGVMTVREKDIGVMGLWSNGYDN